MDTTIADRCRAMGLRVIEVAGWQSRGRPQNFNPGGSVNHHTAGSPNGSTPSLGGVINGFHGSAPGPLANALQSRQPPPEEDIIYVVAAGTANHAGVGGWHGLKGNSRVVGLEIEHTGREPLTEVRQRVAARFHAAMAKGRWGPEQVCQHYEWAPGRKIDAATGVDGNHFRALVAEALGAAPPTPSPGPTPPPAGGAPPFPLPAGHWYGKPSNNPKNHSGYYSQSDAAGVARWQHQMAARGWTIGTDGRFGPQSEGVARSFQAEKGLAVDGLVGAQTWSASWTAPVT